MKNKKLLIGIICTVLIVQFLIPLSMIIKREITLKTGTQYTFKTRPVDPYDPFRGKYVALDFDEAQFIIDDRTEYLRGGMFYAILTVDEGGISHIDDLVREKPSAQNYLRVKVDYVGSKRINGPAPDGIHEYSDNDGKKYYFHPAVNLHLPFNRYYLSENLAPKAEQLYREFNDRDKHDSYVTVRVKNGFAVLEELYLGGKPILEALNAKQYQ